MLRFEYLTGPDPAPRNLLPAGLPDMIVGLADPDTVANVYFRDSSGSLFIEEFDPKPTAAAPFSDLWPAIDASGQVADRAAPIFLGPRVSRSGQVGSSIPVALSGKADPPKPDDVEIGLIDAGIAFWNPAFADSASDTSCRFASFGALKLRDKQFVSGALTPNEIAEYCARPDAANRQALAAKYPQSVYGDRARWPLVRPEGLAHGTAMTDMVLSTAPRTARLHGLELPVSVLRDLSGGQMGAIMEIAVRALVEQVRERRKQADKKHGAGFRLVIIMAFGFTGGPLDGTSDILSGLEQALTDYNSCGLDIELVLPIGNQLQDQLHARLTGGQSVGWRILPDDHSANTVEIICPKGQGGLKLAPPGHDFVDIPDKRGLARIEVSGSPIGALWSEDISGNRVRTRITLVPTAASRPQAPVAPFGKWRICSAESDADIWILRDETGFEADPFQPSRPSWFEDRRYSPTDNIGMPAHEDRPIRPGDPLSVIRRDGSASVLASSGHNKIHVVTAVLKDGQPAPYASQLPKGQVADHAVSLSDMNPSGALYDMQPIGPFVGRAVLGNGGPDRFRAAGTSLAAARLAGEIAAR